MMCFSLSRVFVTYYLAKKVYAFPTVAFILSIFQILILSVRHANIGFFVGAMLATGVTNLVLMTFMHLQINLVTAIENNIKDFLNLLSSKPESATSEKMRVLIFNWRDTKHRWAGGAEAYIHEISKRWVENGIEVTVFCGNDRRNPHNQMLDGVRIIRRGGFYTVYIWAFLYYMLKFRGKFDLVIDSENGIPFFTPIFVKVPKLLLIHHVHQEVFRQYLSFPLAQIAMFLESKMMPFVYKKQKVITVSKSSKIEILKYGFSEADNIQIINPGLDMSQFSGVSEKSNQPLFSYVGRLKPYKNIDIAIKAFAKVVRDYPYAKLQIAGTGESLGDLKKLSIKLNLEKNVFFLGKISDKEKVGLLSKSWVMVQASMIEGWGITVIEANACGTPVIASDVNGLRDSVVDGKTGILAKPKSVDEFYKAMVIFLKDEALRKRMSKEAFLWAKNFSWDKSANDLQEIVAENFRLKAKNIEITSFGHLTSARLSASKTSAEYTKV